MAENTEMNESAAVDNLDALAEKIKVMKEAQKEFSTFTQEQVDEIFFKAAMAANKQRIPLAKMAVEETGMGVVEDKVIKNHFASEYIYNAYKNTKTCGVIEENKAYCIDAVGLEWTFTDPEDLEVGDIVICTMYNNGTKETIVDDEIVDVVWSGYYFEGNEFKSIGERKIK